MPPEAYPVVFGTEMAGSIVALPTNNEILNNADYKKRGFKLGGKVVSVSHCQSQLGDALILFPDTSACICGVPLHSLAICTARA